MAPSELEQLYRRFGYAVFRRCVYLLGSESDAEDALHEVFLRADRYGATLRPGDALPWLYLPALGLVGATTALRFVERRTLLT